MAILDAEKPPWEDFKDRLGKELVNFARPAILQKTVVNGSFLLAGFRSCGIIRIRKQLRQRAWSYVRHGSICAGGRRFIPSKVRDLLDLVEDR